MNFNSFEEKKNNKEKKKLKVRLKKQRSYKVQLTLGLSGGLILFLVGAVGSAGFYQLIIDFAAKNGVLPRDYAELLVLIFTYLALGGGLTVIAGTLIIPKVRRLGNWLIGIGAGISLVSMLVRVYFLGPIIQTYISKSYEDISYLLQAIRLLGIEIGLVGLGVLLAFMATFEVYRWTITIGAMSFFSMLAGLSGDPRIFSFIRESLGIPPQYGVYIDYFVAFLLYVGAVLLVTALLAGAGFIKISKIVVVLCMIATIFSVISILLDLQNLSDYLSLIAIIQYIRAASASIVYAGGIYFIKRA